MYTTQNQDLLMFFFKNQAFPPTHATVNYRNPEIVQEAVICQRLLQL